VFRRIKSKKGKLKIKEFLSGTSWKEILNEIYIHAPKVYTQDSDSQFLNVYSIIKATKEFNGLIVIATTLIALITLFNFLVEVFLKSLLRT